MSKFIYCFVFNVCMDKEIIKKLILKYNSLVPKNIAERELIVEKTVLDKAITIIGPRRAGKSYFLYSLFKKAIKPVFLNFEDNLLHGIKSNELELIKDCSKELFGSDNLVYFFDEIQVIDNWENFIVTLLNEHTKVYLTGSNSKLLSKEISTALRGKSLPYLLLPFSFTEFLEFKKIVLEPNFWITDKSFEIKKLFEEYFEFGGFPELTLTQEKQLKARIITSYYESVIYKDLIERLKIKNTELTKTIINYALNNYANLFSITNLENHLKSTKTPYSLEDVYKILDSLKDIFLTFYVKKYSRSFKKTRLSKTKIYIADNGYIKFLSKEPDAKGRKLENLVFIELFRRKGKIENTSISYFSEKNECDFIIENNKSKQIIQVCYNLNNENKKREINGLLEAMNFFKQKTGLIITNDQEKEIQIKNKKILIKPAWKWLTEKNQKLI
jgi:uncharacterized protein